MPWWIRAILLSLVWIVVIGAIGFGGAVVTSHYVDPMKNARIGTLIGGGVFWLWLLGIAGIWIDAFRRG